MPDLTTRTKIVRTAKEIDAEIDAADLYDKSGEVFPSDKQGYYWTGVLDALDWVLNPGESPTELFRRAYKRPRPQEFNFRRTVYASTKEKE